MIHQMFKQCLLASMPNKHNDAYPKMLGYHKCKNENQWFGACQPLFVCCSARSGPKHSSYVLAQRSA